LCPLYLFHDRWHYDLLFGLQSKHDLKDTNQLLYLIRKKPEGIAVIDLKDAYPTVMEDLQVYAICEYLVLFDEFLLHDIHVLIIALVFVHRTLWKELLGLLA
jgi:hypothetical protein